MARFGAKTIDNPESSYNSIARLSHYMIGVALSLLSSCIFAGLYFYANLLTPLTGKEVFAWRMLLTVPCLTIFIFASKEREHIFTLVRQAKRNFLWLPALLLSSALLGIQQWLFLWAPINERGLEMSLGYFLLPLVMLVVGRVVYKERLTRIQALASIVALIGVVHQYLIVGQLSWVTWLVALGFPAYFIFRKALGTNHLGGFWLDMLLTLPFAICLLVQDSRSVAQVIHTPRLVLAIPILGIFSAVAFVSYIIASRRLTFTLFGLLGYVEPILIVAVALVAGETVRADESLTYFLIWSAVSLLVVDGIARMRKMASASDNR